MIRNLTLVIFLLAFLIRSAGIDSFPPGLWFDEGLNGVDAWNSIHGEGFQLVYPDVFPREPLLVWMLAGVLWLTGPNVIAMRLLVALVGSFSATLLVYLALRTERRRLLAFPVAAGFVLATLHWHAHFSRLVFRTNLAPLIAILSVLAMSKAAAIRNAPWKRLLLWLMTGALVGVGFYTYLSWYFFLPVLAVWFWAFQLTSLHPEAELTRPGFIRRDLAFLILGALAVAAPLFTHYVLNFQDIASRPSALSPFEDGVLKGLQLIGRNLRDVALMFSFRGDHVPLHNVALPLDPSDPNYGKTGSPVLDPVWSVLFYAGLARSIVEIVRRGPLFRIALAWLAWLVFMSLPSVLSQTDSANTLRNLGATPSIAFLIAWGWWWIYEFFQGAVHKNGPRKLTTWIMVGALIWGGGYQVHKLWVRHPKVPNIGRMFSGVFVDMASICLSSSEGAVTFVPTDYFRHKTFQFLTINDGRIRPLDPVELISQPQGGKALPHRVLCSGYTTNFELLNQAFPEGRVESAQIRAGGRPLYWVFRIPASSLLPPDEAEALASQLGLETSR